MLKDYFNKNKYIFLKYVSYTVIFILLKLQATMKENRIIIIISYKIRINLECVNII